MNRRQCLLTLAALDVAPRLAFAGAAPATTRIGAAWRGPNKNDPYFAGVLEADWNSEKLRIAYAVPLSTRPHGLTAESDGGLLVIGVRPGTWLLRCDGEGRIVRQLQVDDDAGTTRLNGHAQLASGSDVFYATETDIRNGRGRIGVRDRRSLQKVDEWDSHGIDPHQLTVDHRGRLIVANGGVPRTLSDKKYDLHRMDSSLARLDPQNGRLLDQWRLDDPRLSLRHLAWSDGTAGVDAYLGVAMQAEHDDPAVRATAPLLAILHEDRLSVPTRDNDGIGYAGDIAPAYAGGFAVSSNQAGLAQLWHPGAPDRLTSIVKLKEVYALAGWSGPEQGGGLLVATALGLVRWLPTAKALFLPWPEPMALDNHWVAMA